jgi:hypothetical protein
MVRTTPRYRQLVLIRSAAEADLREADRLECEAVWNAIMWAGGPGDAVARRAPGGADHRQGINGGYGLLEAKCNRCDRVSLVPFAGAHTPV